MLKILGYQYDVENILQKEISYLSGHRAYFIDELKEMFYEEELLSNNSIQGEAGPKLIESISNMFGVHPFLMLDEDKRAEELFFAVDKVSLNINGALALLEEVTDSRPDEFGRYFDDEHIAIYRMWWD